MKFLSALCMLILAKALGVRITQWVRSEAEDKELNPSGYASSHRLGEAFDFGRETSDEVVLALRSLGKVDFHTSGTAPHYHAEGDEKIGKKILAIVSAIVVVWMINRGRGVEK